jgi:iron complex outermembrane receptor protein
MYTEIKKFKRSGVARAVITALCGTATMLVAQETLAQGQTSLQRVEVTGSNIKRTDTETASPVQVITKEELDQSGKGTVAEFLQTLTADGQGSVPFTYGRGFSGATSAGISLRGLGANATLVLINGRRVTNAVLADDAQRSYPDLNQIPLELVDRIDVLKDGASAIYGSDAVAGVVNIILKKSYVGTVAKLTYGTSQKGDGHEPRLALTHGFGDLDKDGYNVMLNAEFGRKDPIFYRDRVGRGSVGVSAIGQPQWGFNPNAGPNNNINRLGGNGTIPVTASGGLLNNSASQSIIGNVRNPATLNYYSRGNPNGVGFTQAFPGAQAFCNANANLPQNNAGGGCINDMWQQFGQIQPEHETANFYGRFSKQINANTEGWIEVGHYRTSSLVHITSLVPSGNIFFANGNVQSNVAATQLGAAHPDNPYFGTAARLSYNPGLEAGVGPREIKSKAHTTRVVAGLKGSWSAWNYDTAFSYSEASQTDVQLRAINWRVSNALLNPTAANVAAATANSAAYAALPAGTYWRIGENAHLNSAAMYAALLQDKSRTGDSRHYGVDIKVDRELGQMAGGPIGVAFGAELRHEENKLGFYDGLGDYIGLSLTGYEGKRNIFAAYGEVNLPVTKALELNGALRFDRYSDAGNAVTPKIGAKFRPLPNLALRATAARSFRAPSSTENGINSIAAFGGATVNDLVRCAAGVPNESCMGVAPTFVQRGNPDLEPEKSTSFTVGTVWDVTPKTSVTADLWQIKRKGLPVIEDPQAAVDAGRYIRDPATAVTPNDPGAILTGFVVFQNTASSLTRGLDVELKHRMDLEGGRGRVQMSTTWTHLFKQRVVGADGTVFDYAGTHGDCHITNCIGTPRNRVSFAASWETGPWRLGANVNFRGSMSNKEEASLPCASTLANGEDAPGGCKIKSFTTLDLSALYKLNDRTEIFGSIANVFDSKPPFDPLTYGAIGYNALDYSGAIGRFFRIGVKHKFR